MFIINKQNIVRKQGLCHIEFKEDARLLRKLKLNLGEIKMHQIILLLSVVFLSMESFAAGGISSGGGGTLPSNPITIYQARDHIMGAKRDLRLILTYMDSVYKSPDDYYGYEEQLFGGTVTILDLLESKNLEILFDKPCLDAHGNEVDGSIHASRPNTFCMSAFSIAPKLIKERAQKEIAALMAHELSHFLGTSEDQATDLQKRVLRIFDEFVPELEKRRLEEAQSHLQSAISYLKVIVNQAEHKDFKYLEGIYSLFIDEYLDFAREIYRDQRSIYSKKNLHFYMIQDERIQNLGHFIWGNTHKESSIDTIEQYIKNFEGKDQITFAEFYNNEVGLVYEGLFGDFILHRLISKSDIKQEAFELRAYLYEVNNYLHRFISELTYFPLMNPTNMVQNPWEFFIGEYEVKSADCTQSDGPYSGGKVKTFEFFLNEDSKVYRRLGFDNALFTDPHYRGAHNNPGGNVRVSGNASKAVYELVDGDLWGQRWMKRTMTLEPTETGYVLKDESLYQERDWYKSPVKLSSKTCTFHLIKL